MDDKKDDDEMMPEDLTEINALSKALQTVDQESANKMLLELVEVLRNSGGVSVIQFAVVLSILCRIFAEEVENTTAEEIAGIVLALTQSSQIILKRDESKSSLH